jgi:hypothetical protein
MINNQPAVGKKVMFKSDIYRLSCVETDRWEYEFRPVDTSFILYV